MSQMTRFLIESVCKEKTHSVCIPDLKENIKEREKPKGKAVELKGTVKCENATDSLRGKLG